MLKARAYAPYCSGAIQRASKIPSRKFEPEKDRSRECQSTLGHPGDKLLENKIAAETEKSLRSPLTSSTTSSVGLRELSTGTKDLLNPGHFALPLAARPEPAAYRLM